MPPERRLRVAALSELPTPYRWPLFERIARSGAVDLTVLFYARNEADRGWATDVASREGGPTVEFLPGRALHVRGKRSLFFHWNPGVGARVRGGGFDAVVLPGWSMPSTLAAWRACRSAEIPYVVFSETHERARRRSWMTPLRRPLVRAVVSGASAWLATGSLSAAYLARHGADPARTFRFANTPDVERLSAATDAARADASARTALRERHGTPADARVVLFVGRLIGAKDPATLVRAQARLEASGGAPYLWIAGGGAEAASLRAAAASLRNVRFLGAVDPGDLAALLAAADVFCLPSVHESWGVVVNEAMAGSLPVVVSDRVGAGADLVEAGRSGEVFPAGDDEALARVLREVLSDEPRRAAMGRRAREIVGAWVYGPSVDGFVSAVRAACAAGARR